MRPIQLHPLSLVTGFGVAALALIAMSQTPISPTVAPFRPPQTMIAARDMVQIREGTPFVVPSGKLLVVTGLGNSVLSCWAKLSVNNVVEAETGACPQNGEIRSMVPLPNGLAVQPGSTVQVLGNNQGYARAWGYLADQ